MPGRERERGRDAGWPVLPQSEGLGRPERCSYAPNSRSRTWGEDPGPEALLVTGESAAAVEMRHTAVCPHATVTVP